MVREPVANVKGFKLSMELRQVSNYLCTSLYQIWKCLKTRTPFPNLFLYFNRFFHFVHYSYLLMISIALAKTQNLGNALDFISLLIFQRIFLFPSLLNNFNYLNSIERTRLLPPPPSSSPISATFAETLERDSSASRLISSPRFHREQVQAFVTTMNEAESSQLDPLYVHGDP